MSYKFTVKTSTKDETLLEVTAERDEFDNYKEEAYLELSKEVKIEGFRPGKAPRPRIEAKLGSKLISEALGRMLTGIAIDIFEKEGYKPIKQPHYDVVKFDDKEVVFTIKFVDYPKVELGEFSKINVKKKKAEVEEKEVEEVIRSIIKTNIKPERLTELTKKDSNSKDLKKETKTKAEAKKEDVQDEFKLTDEMIKELAYEKENTLEKVKESVRSKLTEMKEVQAEEEFVNNVVKEAVKLSKFDIPEVFIQEEIDLNKRGFESRLEDLKLDKEAYLSAQGKTVSDLEEEWKKQAEEKIGIDLVLIKLAMENDKLATDEDVANELSTIPSEQRGNYQDENARQYIKTVVTRRNAVQLLLSMVRPEPKE